MKTWRATWLPLVGMVGALGGCSTTASTPDAPPVQPRASSAVAKTHQGGRALAPATLRSQRDPSPEAYRAFLAAEMRHLEGDLPGAIDAVTEAIVHDPASVFLRVRLGQLNLSVGDLERATQAAQAALTLNPDDIEALRLFASASNLSGDRELAEKTLSRALEIAPGDRPASTLLAELLIEAEQVDRAERVIDNLMAAEPGATDGYLVLARLFVERGEAERALGYVERALERDGRSPEGLELKIDLLHAAGRFKDAIPTLQALVRERGDTRRTRHRLLCGLLLAGDDEQAMEIAEAWVDEDDSAEMVLLITDALETAGEQDRALAWMHRFEPTGEPKNDRLAVRMARLLLAHDQAGAAVKAVCAQDPSPTDEGWFTYVRVLCARAHVRREQLDQAKTVLEDVTAKLPGSWRPLAALSQLTLSEGAPLSPADVLARIAEARKARPRDIDLLDVQVRALEDHGKPAEATRGLRQALRERPRHPELLMVHARHLERTGDSLAAVAIVERLMDRSDRAETDQLNFAAFTLAEEGARTGEALQWAKRAVLREPLNGYIVDTLGWTQFAHACRDRAKCAPAGLDRAVQTLERADHLAPDEPEILLHLAEALEARGENARALQAAQRAMKVVEARDPIRPRIEAALRRLGGGV